MPKVDVFDLQKKKVGEIEFSDAVFAAPVNESLLHEFVVMQLARRRAGTAKTKKRGEVSGGGKKPWRQKGTGRARQGSIRAAQWVGGGTVFGPQPRDYGYTMPRSARRGAMRSALSAKLRDAQLIVVDDFRLEEIKTKKAAEILQGNFGLEKALIIETEHDDKLRLSVRNLNGFKVLPTEGLNVRDVLGYHTLILTRPAVAKIEERLT